MEFYYHGVDQDVLILSADGGLDSSNAEQFVDELETLVESGIRKLIVDCGRLHYISSYGVGVLVRLHNKLATRGGTVRGASMGRRSVRPTPRQIKPRYRGAPEAAVRAVE